jgi:excisionase family DNA binding protein
MEMMTVEEVAAQLRVKKSWIYSNADRLGAYRLGKYLRFSWPRVLQCLEQERRLLDQSSNDPIQIFPFAGDAKAGEQTGNKIIE